MAESEDLDPALLQEYELFGRKFENVAQECHLPFLEAMLYRKYFIDVKTEDRLSSLKKIVSVLTEHRVQTLQLLKLCHERERVLLEIRAEADEFASHRVTALEAQTKVLQLLYAHQTVTLQVVEGILRWRVGLTRPYPFQWNGKNYIEKIRSDCEFLSQCELKKILPLRLVEFPLCSNITSLSLFGTNVASKPTNKHQEHQAAASPERTKNLRAAEAVIFEEAHLQQRVMSELHAIAQSGSFVPLLNLPHVVPDCTTGIRVTKKDWETQLQGAMKEALTNANDDEQSHQRHRREANEDKEPKEIEDKGQHDSSISPRSEPSRSSSPSTPSSDSN